VSRRHVLAATVAGLAAGLVVAAVATAVTDTSAARNVVGGALLGLVGGVGSSVLRSDGTPQSGSEDR
jgi:hypothetical protein